MIVVLYILFCFPNTDTCRWVEYPHQQFFSLEECNDFIEATKEYRAISWVIKQECRVEEDI